MRLLPSKAVKPKAAKTGKAKSRSRVSSRTILLTLLILVVVFFVPPRLTESWRSSMVEETASLQSQTDSLTAKTVKVDQALADKDLVAKTLGEAQEAIPDTPNLPEVITSIDKVITTGGMTWTSGAPSATSSPASTSVDASGNIVEGPGGGKSWSFPLTVMGPLDRLPGILDALRSMPRMVTVDTVGFQLFGEDQVVATIDARFYAVGE